jgi:hypothetical protein
MKGYVMGEEFFEIPDRIRHSTAATFDGCDSASVEQAGTVLIAVAVAG